MSENTGTIVKSSRKENSVELPALFKADVITSPKCLICNSGHREFVELTYETQRKKNYSEIQRKLKEEKDFEISIPAIRNHIIYHYRARENNAALKEFSENLQKWTFLQKDQASAMRNRIALLEREMYTIAEQGDELTLDERRRNADAIKKLSDAILNYEVKLKELQDEFKPVQIVLNQLQIIVNDELQKVDSERSKDLVVTIMDRFQEACGDIEI